MAVLANPLTGREEMLYIDPKGQLQHARYNASGPAGWQPTKVPTDSTKPSWPSSTTAGSVLCISQNSGQAPTKARAVAPIRRQMMLSGVGKPA